LPRRDWRRERMCQGRLGQLWLAGAVAGSDYQVRCEKQGFGPGAATTTIAATVQVVERRMIGVRWW
jgi:hypothetical protein